MDEFEAGEKILCFHGALLYEAKILKAEYWSDRADGLSGHFYYVHYRGWKQTWDEWVPQSRIMKYTPENLLKQQELIKSEAAHKKVKTEKKIPGESIKKRRRDSMAEKEDVFMKRPEVKIPIPETLKTQLVEDWENVTKNKKLVILPRAINVDQVLNRFREYVRESNKRKGTREGRSDDSLNEVIEGLRLYFNHGLGNILLYRFERLQYVDIKKQYPDKTMAELYGAEHLLRLFVQLPTLIAHTNMDQDAIGILKDHLVQFLGYLSKFQKELFLEDYEAATPAYIAAQKSS